MHGRVSGRRERSSAGAGRGEPRDRSPHIPTHNTARRPRRRAHAAGSFRPPVGDVARACARRRAVDGRITSGSPHTHSSGSRSLPHSLSPHSTRLSLRPRPPPRRQRDNNSRLQPTGKRKERLPVRLSVRPVSGVRLVLLLQAATFPAKQR